MLATPAGTKHCPNGILRDRLANESNAQRRAIEEGEAGGPGLAWPLYSPLV